MSKHTATPWKYSGYEDRCDVGKEYHEILGADGFEVINQNGIVTSAEDAEFIVAACNSHDELLSVLMGCLTDKGAMAYKSHEYAIRRLEAISSIAQNIIDKATGGKV